MLNFVLSDAVQKSPLLIEILFGFLTRAKNNPHILLYWNFLTKMCGVCECLYEGTAGFVLAVRVLIPDSCPFSNFRQLISLLSFVKE